MDTKEKLCQAVRKDGKPCQAKAIKGDYCFAHSPELADKAKAARSLGGKNKSKAKRLAKLMPSRLSPVLEKLERTLDEVHDGKLEPKTAKAMATLADAMIRLFKSSELEPRIKDLEKKYQTEEHYDPFEQAQ